MKIIQMFHLTLLVLTFILKLQFSADTSIADVTKVYLLQLCKIQKLTLFCAWMSFLDQMPQNFITNRGGARGEGIEQV